MFRKISLAAIAGLALTAAAVAPASAGGGHGHGGGMHFGHGHGGFGHGGFGHWGHRHFGSSSMSVEAATRRSSPPTVRAPSTSATASTERARQEGLSRQLGPFFTASPSLPARRGASPANRAAPARSTNWLPCARSGRYRRGSRPAASDGPSAAGSPEMSSARFSAAMRRPFRRRHIRAWRDRNQLYRSLRHSIAKRIPILQSLAVRAAMFECDDGARKVGVLALADRRRIGG